MLVLKPGVRRTSQPTPEAVAPASAPAASPIDAYKRLRDPSPADLFAELKNTAWTCASLNASVCAAHPPRLYVRTAPHQPRPKCLTRPATRKAITQLGGSAEVQIEEVVDNPLLTLLQQVNPTHNAQGLWELTTLHQETIGSACAATAASSSPRAPRRTRAAPPERGNEAPATRSAARRG